MNAAILRGNALALPLADNSVDLAVTSPPYFALRSYQDGGEHYAGQIGSEATPAEFVDALIAATREMVRVVKPSGSIWVNLGDKYSGAGRGNNDSDKLNNTTEMRTARLNGSNRRQHVGKGIIPNKSLMGVPWRYALRCIDDLGLILRAEVIWSKPNGLPESVTDRVRRSHEYWFHFTLEPRYYSAVDEIREQYSERVIDRQRYAGREDVPLSKDRGDRQDGNPARGILGHGHRGLSPLGKLPGSVWEIATQPLAVPASLGVDHFAAFPMEWPRRIIQGWSPVGGVVLDPFGGTGTTALVAEALGRRGVSVDMSADYCRLAEWRTTDEGELARAMQVKKPEKQIEGQVSMFDLLEDGGAA